MRAVPDYQRPRRSAPVAYDLQKGRHPRPHRRASLPEGRYSRLGRESQLRRRRTELPETRTHRHHHRPAQASTTSSIRGHALLQLPALGKKGCSRVVDDAYAFKLAGPPRSRILDNDERSLASNSRHHRRACPSASPTCVSPPRSTTSSLDKTQKKVDRVEKAYARRCHHRTRTLQPAARPLDPLPRSRDQGRVARRDSSQDRPRSRRQRSCQSRSATPDGMKYLNAVWLDDPSPVPAC